MIRKKNVVVVFVVVDCVRWAEWTHISSSDFNFILVIYLLLTVWKIYGAVVLARPVKSLFPSD